MPALVQIAGTDEERSALGHIGIGSVSWEPPAHLFDRHCCIKADRLATRSLIRSSHVHHHDVSGSYINRRLPDLSPSQSLERVAGLNATVPLREHQERCPCLG